MSTKLLLALQTNGLVVAWGDNSDGQSDVPAGLTNVVAVAGGYYHSLALVGNGPPVLFAHAFTPARNQGIFSSSIQTERGKHYLMQFTDSISNPTWNFLPPRLGDGTMTTLTDSAANSLRRFYRVSVQ